MPLVGVTITEDPRRIGLAEGSARDGAAGDLAAGETRPSSVLPADHAPIRGDVARSAAAQAAAHVAEALRTGAAAAERQLQVTLQPEELGRVRFVFSQGEAGLSVTVHAERPEVLDMLRRNIDQFAQDLARQGHGDVAFSFAGGNGREDGGRKVRELRTGPQGAPAVAPTPPPSPAGVAGLDLRL